MAIRKSTKANRTANNAYTTIETCGHITNNIRLTYGKWGDNAEKYDLRSWYTDKVTNEEKPGKGISLTGEQLEVLYNVLKAMVEDEDSNERNNEDNEDNEDEDEEEGGDESDSSPTEPVIISEQDALLEALNHRDTGFAGGKLNLIHIFDTTGWGEKKVTKEQMDDRLAKIIKAFGTGGYGRPSHGYGVDDIWYDPKGYVLNWNDSEGKHEKKFTWRKVEKALRELIEKWRTELDVAAQMVI